MTNGQMAGVTRLVIFLQPLLPHSREKLYIACRLCNTKEEREKHQHIDSIFCWPHMLAYLV